MPGVSEQGREVFVQLREDHSPGAHPPIRSRRKLTCVNDDARASSRGSANSAVNHNRAAR
jgi:hypothetical protein